MASSGGGTPQLPIRQPFTFVCDRTQTYPAGTYCNPGPPSPDQVSGQIPSGAGGGVTGGGVVPGTGNDPLSTLAAAYMASLGAGGGGASTQPVVLLPAPSAGTQVPWAIVLLVVGALGAAWLVVRALKRRAA